MKSSLHVPPLSECCRLRCLILFNRIYYHNHFLKASFILPPSYISARIDNSQKVDIHRCATRTFSELFVPSTASVESSAIIITNNNRHYTFQEISRNSLLCQLLVSLSYPVRVLFCSCLVVLIAFSRFIAMLKICLVRACFSFFLISTPL